MDGVLSEVPEGPEEVLPVAAANADEQVSVEPAEEKSVDNFSNGENSEDAPAEVENASDQLEPTIKSESDAPITQNGMDSNTSCSNSSGAISLLSAYDVYSTFSLEIVEEKHEEKMEIESEKIEEKDSPTTNNESIDSDDGTKCVICNTTMTKQDRPLLLECLHSACSSCIDSKLSEKSNQDIIGM
jgi:RING-type zinc-finger